MLDTIIDHPMVERAAITGYGLEEVKAVQQCCCCEEGIYEGEVYYEIDGMAYCQECVSECKKFA